MPRPYRLVRARRPRQNLWRQLNKPRDLALGSFSHKSVIIGFILVAIIAMGIWTWQSPSSILWHSYAKADPTTPIIKYMAPHGDLAEFNTHGAASYISSGCLIGVQACLRLVASRIFPNGNLSITAGNVYPGAPVNSTVFNSISGIPGNSTIWFDVAGNEAGLTLVFLVTTNSPLTLTFHGSQSNSLVCTCTLSYSGGDNILSFASGLIFSSVLISWAGATSGLAWQQNFGGYALAESKNPVGDLSVAVSKEIELMSVWGSLANSCCANNAGGDPNYDFGFFLTTNKNLWQNGNPNWNPYTDPNIQLYMQIAPLSNGVTISIANTLFIQQRQGETLQSENVPSCGGSEYLCVQGTMKSTGQISLSSYNWLDLNYTGSQNAPQVGSAGCGSPGPPSTGGPGCSFMANTNGQAGTTVFASNTIFPPFQLTSSTYYIGFFSGSLQTVPVAFCFDTSNCAAAVIPLGGGSLPGCSAASMEIDFCVPTPGSVVPTTDSGGFFGTVGRFLGGVGNLVVGGATGLFNTIVSPLSNALSGVEGAFVSAITTAFQVIIFGFVTIMNQVGSWLGLGPIGTSIVSFFSSVVTFVTGLFGTLFNQLGNVASTMVNLFAGIGVLLGTYWADLTIWITDLTGIIGGFWNVVGLGLGLGIGAGFIIFWIYGMLQAVNSFEEWQGWTALLLQIVLAGINLMLWLLAIVWNRILFPMVQIVKGWL